MRQWLRIVLVGCLAAGLGAAGCGGGGTPDGGGGDTGGGGGDTGGGQTPAVLISSPMAQANVALPANGEIPVTFSVSSFALMAPGQCAPGAANCGHVHLLIDGQTCNAPGMAYNNAGATSPITANLNACPMASRVGVHVLTLELHNDDHSPVMAGGMVVSASVMITVTSGTPTGPALAITSPTAGATVTPTMMGAMSTTPVAFNLTGGVTLRSPAPGTACPTAICGHIHINIDGNACNAGMPYNGVALASPALPNFAACPAGMRTGMHTISLTLENDSHVVIMSGGMPVAASVMVNVAN
jgi:hypothetical protein